MKEKLPVFLAAVSIVLLIGFSRASFAVECANQTFTGGYFYDIYVPPRKWCNLYNVTVSKVYADRASSIAIVGSTLSYGNIRMEGVIDYVWLDGSLVLESNIDVKKSHGVRLTLNKVQGGSVVVSGSRGESRWATTLVTGNSIIDGDLTIETSSAAYVLRNNVSGVLTCNDNRSLIQSENTAGVGLACID